MASPTGETTFVRNSWLFDCRRSYHQRVDWCDAERAIACRTHPHRFFRIHSIRFN